MLRTLAPLRILSRISFTASRRASFDVSVKTRPRLCVEPFLLGLLRTSLRFYFRAYTIQCRYRLIVKLLNRLVSAH
ncbi:MAG: hypothetical protein H0T60_14240 [Acidobacteria bacterium]|nr:hypothetical protein [Acidobacteriota bacterium]